MSNVYQRDLQISIPTFWRAATTGGYAYPSSIAWDTAIDIRMGYIRLNNDYSTTVVQSAGRVYAAAGMAATPAAWQWIPVNAGSLPSLYRVDFPAAAFATGARYVVPFIESYGSVFFQPIATDMLVADDLAATRTTDAQLADKFLARNIKGGSDAGTGQNVRSVGAALAAVRNRVVRSGNTLTVYDTDDSTTLWTATVTGFTGNVEMEPV